MLLLYLYTMYGRPPAQSASPNKHFHLVCAPMISEQTMIATVETLEEIVLTFFCSKINPQ